MNNITVFGRVTREIELKYTSSKVAYARFNLASKSSVRGADGEFGVNFFPCLIWRDKAERLAKFVKKGDPLVVKGSFNSRDYEKNGTKNTIWELNIEDFAFVSSKDDVKGDTELVPMDDESAEDLPF